jgi:hypothetical protein
VGGVDRPDVAGRDDLGSAREVCQRQPGAARDVVAGAGRDDAESHVGAGDRL